jgi:hypothetical protein
VTINVYLQGGLGNQLFQLAAALMIKHQRKGESVRLSPDLLGKVSSKNRRQFSIESLLKVDEIINNTLPTPILVKPLHFIKILDFEDEQRGNLTESYLRFQTRHLIGYFQNITTVDFVWNEIRTRLQTTPVFEKLLSEAPVNYVAVHIRLGDYLKEVDTNEVHGTCSVDYYLNALEVVAKKCDCNSVKVVSDDVATAKKIFDDYKLALKYDLEFRENQTEIDDLAVLARASGVVMSNSTFSWWGAYIASKQRNCFVVYPTPWFLSTDFKTQNLFPSSWETLSR